MPPRGDPRRPRKWAGQYLAVRHLNEGGMGSVELAYDPRADRLCVIKRMLPGTRASPVAHERFRREAAILARLEHRSIARLHSLDPVAGTAALVQEFVHGRDLAQLLDVCATAGVRIPLAAVTHIVVETAAALDHAHHFRGLGLVHRDVAPQNVMVSFTGDVKLLDFGVAKTAVDDRDDRLTVPGQPLGRRAYMAPEVLVGGSATHQTDVYSLGLILWELLAGRPLAAVRLASPRERPAPSKFNAAVGPRLDAIALKAIAWRPADRFAGATDLEQALRGHQHSSRPELRSFLALHYDLGREQALLTHDLEQARRAAGGAPGEGTAGRFPRRFGILLLGIALALAGTFTWVAERASVSHAKQPHGRYSWPSP
jgi:eukaryotic-like serine/threonine-protein kinase